MAIVAAGLWAFYIFVYQEKIKPAGDPASLTPSIAVRRLGRDARREILSVDVHLLNSGKTEIDVAADGFNVWGERYADRDAVVVKTTATSHEFRRNVPLRARTLVESFSELRDRAVGGKPGRHITIEAGTTEDVDWIVVVPRGEYDVIEAQIICVPVKTSTVNKVDIAVENDARRGMRLSPRARDVSEDDASTHFALIP